MEISELKRQMDQGILSSESLVRECLERIYQNDKQGKGLNTVSELNPFAIYEAMACDMELKEGKIRGPLHGIPILLKDNIDVSGLHTTAGSYALQDLIAERDSTVAEKLKKAGAIILGKANLSEFAYWMSSKDMPCGFSSLSGQVVHAYNPKFDPSGSSTGSAVAVSAEFVPAAIGSETCGSLMSPGIANAIVSLKPTVGLVSRDGILPISHSQDTAGPMAKSVRDVAMLLSVMAGKDEKDSASKCIWQEQICYEDFLDGDLSGMRIGLYRNEDRPLNEKEEAVQKRIREIILAAGGQVIDILYKSTAVECSDILTGEFKNGINRYLAAHNSSCRTLSDIISFNKDHADRCLKHGQDLLEDSEALSGFLKEDFYIRERMDADRKTRELIDEVMAEENLDCLVTACGRITSFAAVRGTCSMVVPAVKFNEEVYEPISYFLVGKPFGEKEMLRLGYSLEKETKIYNKPSWLMDE